MTISDFLHELAALLEIRREEAGALDTHILCRGEVLVFLLLLHDHHLGHVEGVGKIQPVPVHLFTSADEVLVNFFGIEGEVLHGLLEGSVLDKPVVEALRLIDPGLLIISHDQQEAVIEEARLGRNGEESLSPLDQDVFLARGGFGGKLLEKLLVRREDKGEGA